MDTEHGMHDADNLEAARGPGWLYDETKPCGVDYNDATLARRYDNHHRSFRDYRKEAEDIVARLDAGPSATVIDMGCGTGAFALYAAGHCQAVHAVDVSAAMLRRAQRKADRMGLKNIEFHHGGFLTYDHKAEPADAISTVAALHHLPDFWKLVALRRLASMLKPNGRLFLFDVVFSFDIGEYDRSIEQFVRRTHEQMGENGRNESETHVRDEYSTCDWIMEGLLEKSGFHIQTAEYQDGFLASYLCTKTEQWPCRTETGRQESEATCHDHPTSSCR
jgi:ubiquinone/menaquinone biosynthesis C-methylase UbiE